MSNIVRYPEFKWYRIDDLLWRFGVEILGILRYAANSCDQLFGASCNFEG